MFFLRMVTRSVTRQPLRRLFIALVVALSACVSTAMLGVVFDVGDKINAELSTYGSNITVAPKASAVVDDLYSSQSGGSSSSAELTAFLKESSLPAIKTIFWSYNIVDFTPRLDLHATVGGTTVPIVGTWFSRTLRLDSGETTTVGLKGMRSWWTVTGSWAKDSSGASTGSSTVQGMLGTTLASSLGVGVGDVITLHRDGRSLTVKVVGVMDSGDDDDGALYLPSAAVQRFAGLQGRVSSVEVRALTTPENDLARKAARNPAALSQDEWETWYCTAYPSSIAYQIEEAIPGSVARQVRQVAAVQGSVLNKTRAVMIVMTALSLVAEAVAVANLLAASISERAGELALSKALGATDAAVCRLMLAETALVATVGAVTGMALGSAVAQGVGYAVFGSGVTMRPMVFVLVAVLLVLAVLVASFSTLRSILGLRPAEVLHGR